MMKAKQYFEQIKPHIDKETFVENLSKITVEIIKEGAEIAATRKVQNQESLCAVYKECDLKFQSLCRMIEKVSTSYTLEPDLFEFIFEIKFPKIYCFVYRKTYLKFPEVYKTIFD